MTTKRKPKGAGPAGGSPPQARINRMLLVAALLSIALGALEGEALITWLNATLL